MRLASRPKCFRTQLFVEFKVVLFTLYVDVKELVGTASHPLVRLFGFPWSFELKIGCVLLFAGNGGPDWTRTSDPALIKRML